MKCRYAQPWGCVTEARIDGYCLPHGVLFLWLVEGEGDEGQRIRDHDAIARMPEVELTATLRREPWDSRIRAVLMSGKVTR